MCHDCVAVCHVSRLCCSMSCVTIVLQYIMCHDCVAVSHVSRLCCSISCVTSVYLRMSCICSHRCSGGMITTELFGVFCGHTGFSGSNGGGVGFGFEAAASPLSSSEAILSDVTL